MTVVVCPEPGLVGLAHVRVGTGDALLCPAEDAAAARVRFPRGRVVSFAGGNLTPARDDLPALARVLGMTDGADGTIPMADVALIRDETRAHGWDAYATTLGLLGARRARLAGQSGETPLDPPRRPDMGRARSLLLTACGGVGNLIQTTPLLAASLALGLETFFRPVADAPGCDPAPLFAGAAPGLTVLAPGDPDPAAPDVRLNIEARAFRRPGEFFHSPYRESPDRSEAGACARFFENVVGRPADPGRTLVGGFDTPAPEALRGRVVLCPGSKPGWDSKRWPHFAALAARLDRPVVLCREADLAAYDRLDFLAPLRGARADFVTGADLPGAAALLRSARGVVANDCGPAHVAAAAGAPVLILFGPSSPAKNRPLAPNARCLGLELACRPCQGRRDGPGRLGPGEFSCELGYPCLRELTVDRVLAEADALFNATGARA